MKRQGAGSRELGTWQWSNDDAHAEYEMARGIGTLDAP